MVVPDRDPRELLVRQGKIRIETVGSCALAVIVERVSLPVRKRFAEVGEAGFVLVDVIAEVEDVIRGILGVDGGVGVEVAFGVVGAGVDCQLDVAGDGLVFCGDGLCAADDGGFGGVADVEAVKVGCEGLEVCCFKLGRVGVSPDLLG